MAAPASDECDRTKAVLWRPEWHRKVGGNTKGSIWLIMMQNACESHNFGALPKELCMHILRKTLVTVFV